MSIDFIGGNKTKKIKTFPHEKEGKVFEIQVLFNVQFGRNVDFVGNVFAVFLALADTFGQ